MTATSYVSEELMIVWLLLLAAITATYIIQRRRLTWLPPSSSAMLLGILAGGVSRIAGLEKQLRFSPAAFFYALLPPIVYQAGFSLKKRAFFANAAAILVYAVLGTFISALVFGLCTYLLYLVGIVRGKHLAGSPFVECLAYGSAISSIDPVATLAVLADVPVPPLLYNLVFGESVMNDAVAIVLFRSLTDLADRPFGLGTLPAVFLRFCVLGIGSLLIGVAVALTCAWVLKRFTSGEQQHPVTGMESTSYEIAIVVMGSYLAYLVAEVAGMSGIVALFFSGICHSHYTYYSASHAAQITLRNFFEFAAWLCEMFVFAYLGLQVATMQHAFDFGLFFSGIPLAFVSRAANIELCSRLINTWRAHKLPRRLQRMLLAVGLRGAVAYGLVINLPRTDQPGQTGIPAIETAALLIVVVTTLGLGSATGPLLRHFELEGKDDYELLGLSSGPGGLSDAMAPGAGAPRIEVESRSRFAEWFKALDEEHLKPLFGGRLGGDATYRGSYGADGSFRADSDSRSGTPRPAGSLQREQAQQASAGPAFERFAPGGLQGGGGGGAPGGRWGSGGGGGGYQGVAIQMEAPGGGTAPAGGGGAGAARAQAGAASDEPWGGSEGATKP